ncbi:18500_t:CDS:2, partial [Gigaspora rosea]
MAKQTQVSASQTVKLVRQPRGPLPSLQMEEGIENYNLTQYLNNLGIFSTEDFEKNYPIKPFQRSRPQIDRIENAINEERNVVNQLTNQFEKVYIRKCDICGEIGHSKGKCPNQPTVQSNYTQSYFTSLKPIYPQYIPPNLDNSEEDEVGYNEEDNQWHTPPSYLEKKWILPTIKSDDQLLELLSPAMRKKIIDPSTKNKWAESHEYIQCRIEDIILPDGFADTALGCLVMNKALNEALGWNLGMDVPIFIKYKNKCVTETGHVVIDNRKPDYLFCLGRPWIQKVQGILDTNKHEFRMIVRGKSYIIPTFTKPIKDNVSSSLYTTVIQDNNSKNQTFDSSIKIDTKEKPASNEKK